MPFAIARDGARIHHLAEGPVDAPPLLLSNALGTDLTMWDRQARRLTGFRLIRYDPRGHGQSDAPSGEYTLEQLGQDALSVLDVLGIERADVCGISMGGAVGQWLALHAPERVRRLVLANTAAVFGTPDAWVQRIDAVRSEGMGAVAPGLIERWFTPAFRDRDPDEAARIEAMLLAQPSHGYVGCCAALRDTHLRGSLQRITAPTLVIGGARDPATPPERAQELASGVPGARLVMLDSAHMSCIEAADEFSQALEGFLRPL